MHGLPPPFDSPLAWLIAPFAVILMLKITFSRPDAQKRSTRAGPQHYRRTQVLTANELEFHRRLLAALPDGAELWPQVGMLGAVQPLGGDTYGRAKSQITNARIDWVIAVDGEARIAIELDDATHETKRDRDRERDAILAGCGYAVLRYESRAKPSIADLDGDIERALAGRERTTRRGWKKAAPAR